MLQNFRFSALSRQRSRVRAPSSPPYIPKDLLELAEFKRGAEGTPICVPSAPLSLLRSGHDCACVGRTSGCSGSASDFGFGENTSDMTAAWAACLAGVIAWV